MGDDRTEPEGGGRGRLTAGVVIGAVVGAAVVLFIVQNTRSTEVKWLVFEFQQPLWVVLLVTAAASLVAAELLGAARRRRKRRD